MLIESTSTVGGGHYGGVASFDLLLVTFAVFGLFFLIFALVACTIACTAISATSAFVLVSGFGKEEGSDNTRSILIDIFFALRKGVWATGSELVQAIKGGGNPTVGTFPSQTQSSRKSLSSSVFSAFEHLSGSSGKTQNVGKATVGTVSRIPRSLLRKHRSKHFTFPSSSRSRLPSRILPSLSEESS